VTYNNENSSFKIIKTISYYFTFSQVQLKNPYKNSKFVLGNFMYKAFKNTK